MLLDIYGCVYFKNWPNKLTNLIKSLAQIRELFVGIHFFWYSFAAKFITFNNVLEYYRFIIRYSRWRTNKLLLLKENLPNMFIRKEKVNFLKKDKKYLQLIKVHFKMALSSTQMKIEKIHSVLYLAREESSKVGTKALQLWEKVRRLL